MKIINKILGTVISVLVAVMGSCLLLAGYHTISVK